MKLISKIRIEGFRSIHNSMDALDPLGNFCSFSGLNNSGKSNVLRALNLFFRGETDQKTPIAFGNDYYRYDLGKRRKVKAIEISIHFSLPSIFKYTKKLQHVEGFLGRSFAITKRWTRESIVTDYYLNENTQALNLEEKQKVDQFLSLINFRYIPNRVLPIELIRSEHKALRDTLVRRLGKQGKYSAQPFKVIKSTSDKLIESFSGRIRTVVPAIDSIRLATPQTWADLIFAFGYRLGTGGVEIDDVAQGSGIQSLLMLETLYLIDKDYFQRFGWRQASIWAMEEPESSLHCSMEAQVALFLSKISTDPNSRLQIFVTTHSDLIMQYADRAYFTEMRDYKTNFEGNLKKEQILLKSSQAGVSRYAHPILHYPLNPILIVDGKYDESFLKHAIPFLKPKLDLRTVYLEKLDPYKSGGEQDILDYIKDHRLEIKNRNRTAPVIVLLDWESRKRPEFDKVAAGLEKRLLVFQWPKNSSNPLLDESFRGIERFYSDRLIDNANENCPNIIATKSNGTKTVNLKEYEQIKRALWKEIEDNGLIEQDLKLTRDFLTKMLKSIEKSMQGQDLPLL